MASNAGTGARSRHAPMVHLIAETSPLELAWLDYDTAILCLHAAYGSAGEQDTLAERRGRMELGLEAARLWKVFMALAEAEQPTPRPVT